MILYMSFIHIFHCIYKYISCMFSSLMTGHTEAQKALTLIFDFTDNTRLRLVFFIQNLTRLVTSF